MHETEFRRRRRQVDSKRCSWGCLSVIVFDGVTNPVILEAYTCREALDLADDLYLQKLAIASDCKSVVNEINSKSFGSKEWYDCAGHLPIQIEVSNFGLRT
jgi:hypothetical protein